VDLTRNEHTCSVSCWHQWAEPRGKLKGIITGSDSTLWLSDDGQIGHFFW